MAHGKVAWTFKDKQGQSSVASFQGAVITAANLDAQETLIAALRAATLAMQTGVIVKDDVHSVVTPGDPTKASNPLARRELKCSVEYMDDVTYKVYRTEIPCVDLANTDTADERKIDKAAGDGLAFVTAFEAYVLSPVGNAVTVQDLWIVGRNT